MNPSWLIQHATLRDMSLDDLPVIVSIEQRVHVYPWSRGNFTDSLKGNHVCKVCESMGEVLGYFVLMLGVDEAHLLNISITAKYQRQGLGRELLNAITQIARDRNMLRVLLEVRLTNLAAQALYQNFGLQEIGRRRGYYSSANGREDAIVMEYAL